MSKSQTLGQRIASGAVDEETVRRSFFGEEKGDEVRDQNWWVAEYKRRGALWVHDNNPRRPHALLTSRRHSSGFFDSGVAMQDPILLEKAVFDLLGRVSMDTLEDVSYVVGPAMGAITLAYEMARQMSHRNETDPTLPPSVLTAFAEKIEDGAPGMVLKRVQPYPGSTCLPVEDVLTTGGSVEAMIRAIASSSCYLTGFLFCLVNRSGQKELAGKQVVPLIEMEMPTWEPSECPLCQKGSEAIRPKGAQNRERLSRDYGV
jgi:orotate phosphoribosyltransferase